MTLAQFEKALSHSEKANPDMLVKVQLRIHGAAQRGPYKYRPGVAAQSQRIAGCHAQFADADADAAWQFAGPRTLYNMCSE